MKAAIRNFIFTAVPTKAYEPRKYDVDIIVTAACVIIGIALAIAAAFGKL